MNTADLFLWILDNLNYWVVALFMAIESSFIPFPSEVVVPPAAWKAMDPNSGMSFILVIVLLPSVQTWVPSSTTIWLNG